MKYNSQSWGPGASEEEKSFRSFISNDPALSYFLEMGALRKNSKFSKEEIYKEPKFLAFISPYFESVYTAAVIRCFETRDTNLISDIAANPLLLDDAHKQSAFSTIEQFLAKRLKQLEFANNQIQSDGPIIPSELEEHTGIITICLLNYLPQDFQSIRTDFCKQIMTTVRLLISKDFSLALSIATNLRQLKCDAQATYDADNLYQTLVNANEKANAISASQGSSGGGQLSVWGIIGIILLIIKLILLFAR
ncbi:hypothetical protein SAMN05518672_114112 [Chitinophaga sp. CF118]|uniref:hypothetical protein n=1 Tax=Chitinophaga sp. CF118 TaxID=1884367 RepID=UPI0008EF5172|nr:hypothetical protein [Chitinophaga sp. CF118]SFF02773.1 hypothetical protein SAMN05518672_114112 [Chitinophaga sp. CF118]